MSWRHRAIGKCLRKARYRSPEMAGEVLNKMKSRPGHQFLNVYACQFCHGWHLGNSITVNDAAKSLSKLENMMDNGGFKRAPTEVQTKLRSKRKALIAYLLERL